MLPLAQLVDDMGSALCLKGGEPLLISPDGTTLLGIDGQPYTLSASDGTEYEEPLTFTLRAGGGLVASDGRRFGMLPGLDAPLPVAMAVGGQTPLLGPHKQPYLLKVRRGQKWPHETAH